MSWFARGSDPQSTKFKEENTNPKKAFRFFLKSGEKKKIIFLSDDPFVVYEGTVRVGPKEWETFTCSCDEKSYLLRNKINRVVAEHYTVLDMTPFTDKTGKERKYFKKTLPATGVAQEMIKRRREANGGTLVGYVVEVARDGEKAPRCGNDFLVKEKVDLSKLPPEDTKPLDYPTLLKPLPYHTIEAVVNGASSSSETPETFSRSGLSEEAVGDIPF